jgi:hypothetical protein
VGQSSAVAQDGGDDSVLRSLGPPALLLFLLFAGLALGWSRNFGTNDYAAIIGIVGGCGLLGFVLAIFFDRS